MRIMTFKIWERSNKETDDSASFTSHYRSATILSNALRQTGKEYNCELQFHWKKERKNARHTRDSFARRKAARFQYKTEHCLKKNHASQSIRSKRLYRNKPTRGFRPKPFTHKTAWACKRSNPSWRTSLAVEAATLMFPPLKTSTTRQMPKLVDAIPIPRNIVNIDPSGTICHYNNTTFTQGNNNLIAIPHPK